MKHMLLKKHNGKLKHGYVPLEQMARRASELLKLLSNSSTFEEAETKSLEKKITRLCIDRLRLLFQREFDSIFFLFFFLPGSLNPG